MSRQDNKTYIAIDLKSFFASVECVERGLDPLTTNLVVADESRTEKTICLAVTPPLKAYGVGGRARLFEVIQRICEVNIDRRSKIPNYQFKGKSSDDVRIKQHPDWEIDFIRAVPRMATYIEYSTRIYQVYLKYIAAEDIHTYSIDEVIMDVSSYLSTYKMTAHELAMMMIHDVLDNTGITATAGIGTNMYLCKVAMDIVAKHIPADKDGVRIAELDEISYRKQLWSHRPITDFWRVGRGIADKLVIYGIDCMGKLARLSLTNENLLYKLFGVNAELLIDHAWGWEPCTMDYVKAYKPETNSMSRGQVLQEPYTFKKALVVVKEMADSMSLDLVDKHLVTDQVVLNIGYDKESLTDSNIAAKYNGSVVTDYYGRKIPKSAHGTVSLGEHVSSSRVLTDAIAELYHQIVNKDFLIRRINISMNRIISENKAKSHKVTPVQLDMFTDYEELEKQNKQKQQELEKEHRIQEALLAIKQRYGKNSILKGISYDEGATAKDRNNQIGGHRS